MANGENGSAPDMEEPSASFAVPVDDLPAENLTRDQVTALDNLEIVFGQIEALIALDNASDPECKMCTFSEAEKDAETDSAKVSGAGIAEVCPVSTSLPTSSPIPVPLHASASDAPLMGLRVAAERVSATPDAPASDVFDDDLFRDLIESIRASEAMSEEERQAERERQFAERAKACGSMDKLIQFARDNAAREIARKNALKAPAPAQAPTTKIILPAKWRVLTVSQKHLSAVRVSDQAVTLNLSPKIELAVRRAPNPTSYLAKRINRELRAAGLELPFTFRLELSPNDRLHLHGSICSGYADLALVGHAFRKAGGLLKPSQRARQFVMKDLFDADRWCAYYQKASAKTQTALPCKTLAYISTPMRQIARSRHEARKPVPAPANGNAEPATVATPAENPVLTRSGTLQTRKVNSGTLPPLST